MNPNGSLPDARLPIIILKAVKTSSFHIRSPTPHHKEKNILPLGKRFLVRADHLVAQFTGEISSKRMSGQSPDTGEPEKSIEAGLQSPPGRSHLASLMSSRSEERRVGKECRS